MVAYTRSLSHRDTERPALWARALVDLFGRDNILARRANGTVACGHEPWHGSRSGQCVVIWPLRGRWWCSSCGQAGDAVTYVMQRDDCDYATAVQWLGERYGFPKNWCPGWRERTSWPRRYVALSAPSPRPYRGLVRREP
jgi:hypothetical protein